MFATQSLFAGAFGDDQRHGLRGGPWPVFPRNAHASCGGVAACLLGLLFAGLCPAVAAAQASTVPPAPTKPAVSPGHKQVTLTWSSTGNGGSPITTWQYAYKGLGSYGDWTDVPNSGAGTTSYTVTGLTRGTYYNFKVRAVNSVGNGAESPESDAVNPKATLRASNVTQTTATMTLSHTGDWWWTIYPHPLNIQHCYKATGMTMHLAGLSPNVVYHFSAWSDENCTRSNATQIAEWMFGTEPKTGPLPPRTLSVAGGNSAVTLTWIAGGNGGSPITGWQYARKEKPAGQNEYSDYGAWMNVPNSGANTTSYTVTGLTNGTAYQFKVRAVNEVGNGFESLESDAVTPSATSSAPAATVPPPPNKPTVATRDRSVTLTWTSTGNGGSAIIRWQYQRQAGDGAYGAWTNVPDSSESTSTYTVTGLINNTIYRFKVRAVNGVGNGAESPESAAVTPSATPRGSAVTGPPAPNKPAVVARDRSVTLTWTSTGTGGSAIFKWQYQQQAGAGAYGTWTNVPNSSEKTTTYTVTGLTNDVTYRFKVRAVNGIGPGTASVASDPARPFSVVEQVLLTNVLAAQGRALLTNATDAIGQRFRAPGPDGAAEGGEGDGATKVLGTVSRLLGMASGRGDAPDGAFGARDPLSTDTGPGRHGPREAGPEWTPDQLAGRSFALPLSAMGAKGLQGWTLWGAGAMQHFEGSPDAGQYDGPLSSLYLGLDTRLGPEWLVGAAVSHSWGETDYTVGEAGRRNGRLETRLTSLYPYVQAEVASGLELWAMGGYGWGEVEAPGDGQARAPEASDLTMGMGAAGLRQPLTEQAGVQVALVGGAGYLALSTEDGIRAVDDLNAEVLQARVAVEATRAFGALKPYLQVGGRADGGDGQTGTGLEVAGGLRYTADRLDFEARGRWLATHSAEGYEEYSGMARLAVKARPDGTGLRVSVAPSWGRADATGALLGDGAPLLGGSALSTLAPRGAGTAPALALASDLGYGVPLWTGLLTPSVGYGYTVGGLRASLGVTYASPPTPRAAGQDLSLRLGYAPPPTVRAAADYRLEVLWSRGF